MIDVAEQEVAPRQQTLHFVLRGQQLVLDGSTGLCARLVDGLGGHAPGAVEHA